MTRTPPRRRVARFAVFLAGLVAATRVAADQVTTYTLNADFDRGQALHVHHDVPDQLQLRLPADPLPYIWVAASERGTVCKIDVRTGAVLGEYLSAPDGLTLEDNLGRNPSRTTVDRLGNVWVGNRGGTFVTNLVGEDGRAFTFEDGSVVKIGLAELGHCQDRNGDGDIDTSTGLGDVRPWTNPGSVNSLGGVSSAADECILIFKRVDPPHVRHVSVDSNNDIWVGGDGISGKVDKKIQQLDGDTGDILRTIDFNLPADTGEPAPLFPTRYGASYGGVSDCRDILWCAGYLSNILVRVNPSVPAGDPDLIRTFDLGVPSYGLGLAPDGTLWHTHFSSSSISHLDRDGNLISGPHPTMPGNIRGICVTPDGHSWVANTTTGTVTRHAPDGSIVADIACGSGPTGVAMDGEGKVWTTNRFSGEAVRIDPATNSVDLVVDLDVPGHPYGELAGPYNYSDMTGVIGLTQVPTGTWTVVTEGPCRGALWSRASWSVEEPPGTEIFVDARAADTPALLGLARYRRLVQGANTSLRGRYLETRVRFGVLVGAACDEPDTPILHDLTVEARDVTAPFLACPLDVTLECGSATPEAPRAEDACGEVVLSLVEVEETMDCPAPRRVIRTWTARDEAGNESTCSQVVTLEDLTAPVLEEAPADVIGNCASPPAAAVLRALDACQGDIPVVFDEVHVPGPCTGSETLERTWRATDSCGNEARETQIVRLIDGGAPTLNGVPADASYLCEAPAAPAVTATDSCDPSPTVTLIERVTPGRCASEYDVIRTWTAIDDCGSRFAAAQRVRVRDDGPPTLSGVPASGRVACAAPPPATVTAVDGCDDDPALAYLEERAPGDCPSRETIVRTWTAIDDCGYSVQARQVIEVGDDDPPRIEVIRQPGCLWPPDHRYACFTDITTLVTVTDDCPGDVTLLVVGCNSDQPDDQQGPDDRGVNGDGNTENDCVVALDGSGFCARSERLGNCPAGRTYGVTVRATDACGNAAETVLSLHVPHDQREHPDCSPDGPQIFLKQKDPLPFAWTPRADVDAGLPDPFTCD